MVFRQLMHYGLRISHEFFFFLLVFLDWYGHNPLKHMDMKHAFG